MPGLPVPEYIRRLDPVLAARLEQGPAHPADPFPAVRLKYPLQMRDKPGENGDEDRLLELTGQYEFTAGEAVRVSRLEDRSCRDPLWNEREVALELDRVTTGLTAEEYRQFHSQGPDIKRALLDRLTPEVRAERLVAARQARAEELERQRVNTSELIRLGGFITYGPVGPLLTGLKRAWEAAQFGEPTSPSAPTSKPAAFQASKLGRLFDLKQCEQLAAKTVRYGWPKPKDLVEARDYHIFLGACVVGRYAALTRSQPGVFAEFAKENIPQLVVRVVSSASVLAGPEGKPEDALRRVWDAAEHLVALRADGKMHTPLPGILGSSSAISSFLRDR